MIKGKRGSGVLDMSIFLLLLLIVFFALVVCGYIMIQITSPITSATGISLAGDYANNFPTIMDYLFLTMLALIWVGLFISSWLLDSNPIFFIVFLIPAIIIIVVMLPIANVITSLSGGTLAGIMAQFPIFNWIVGKWLLVMAFFIASVGIALYGKNQGGSAGL